MPRFDFTRTLRFGTLLIVGASLPAPACAQDASIAPLDSSALSSQARQAVQSFLDMWRAEWVRSASVGWRPRDWPVTYLMRHEVTDDVLDMLADRHPLPDSLRTLPARHASTPSRWAEYWSGLGRVSRPRPGDGRNMATAHVRCMRDAFPWGRVGALSPIATRIPGAGTARAWCPGWIVSGMASVAPDQRLVVDSALPPARRSRVRAQRDSLLALLAVVANRIPADGWVTGQRVRFLVDQQRTREAVGVARQCAAEPWWCGLLTGYALAMDGDSSGAEVIFARVRQELPPPARCAWDDVRHLLEPDEQRRYLALPCTARDSLHARLWWLADPLWSDSVNERRLEHAVRRVALLLRQATPRDERFNWGARMAGDAAEAMLVRYGWPSFMAFHEVVQRAQDQMLAKDGSPPSGPYASAEYPESRVHTVPRWRAVADPLAARSEDWSLHEPDTLAARADSLPPCDSLACRPGWRRLTDHWTLTPEQLREVWPHAVLWWPAEHFEPARPLVQFPDPQLALLRRQHAIELYAATRVIDPLAHPDARFGYPPRPRRSAGDARLAVALVSSPSPEELIVAAVDTVRPGARAVLRTTLPPRPTLLGVEIRDIAPDGGDARTRFAIRPPPSLSSLRTGELAVSAPVLIDGDAVRAGNGVTDAAEMLAAMRTSTRVLVTERLGVYWESYGAHAHDSIDVGVRIARDDSPSFMRRAAVALKMAEDPRFSVTVRWRDGASGHPRYVLSGSDVPVIARHVVLDVSRLTPGLYWLDVSVRRSGDEPVYGRIRIRIG